MTKTFFIFFVSILMLNTYPLPSETVKPGDPVTKRFQNKVVIVTGASKGIGKGIATSFALEGASLVLVARDETALKQTANELQGISSKVIAIRGDVSSLYDMENLARETVAKWGKIDILCHNAGIYPLARLEGMNLAEWKQVIDVNLTGTFLAVKACLPYLKKQGGKIVITSSISGPKTALPGYSHYTASKGGVAGFIKTAAVELAKYKINVNAVEPGNIITEGFEAMGKEHMETMARPIPLGRLGTVTDVANAALFLASEDASYITGQSIVVDGGQTLPESQFAEY